MEYIWKKLLVGHGNSERFNEVLEENYSEFGKYFRLKKRANKVKMIDMKNSNLVQYMHRTIAAMLTPENNSNIDEALKLVKQAGKEFRTEVLTFD